MCLPSKGSLVCQVPGKESLRTPEALQVCSAPSLSQYTSCSKAESQAKLCSHALLHSLILRRIPTPTWPTSARRGSRVGWQAAALAPLTEPLPLQRAPGLAGGRLLKMSCIIQQKANSSLH